MDKKCRQTATTYTVESKEFSVESSAWADIKIIDDLDESIDKLVAKFSLIEKKTTNSSAFTDAINLEKQTTKGNK